MRVFNSGGFVPSILQLKTFLST